MYTCTWFAVDKPFIKRRCYFMLSSSYTAAAAAAWIFIILMDLYSSAPITAKIIGPVQMSTKHGVLKSPMTVKAVLKLTCR